MPIPTITCTLCGASISKRQSLLIKPYGRICRSHPEVQQHIDKLNQDAKAKATEDKLRDGFQQMEVIAIGGAIRSYAFIYGYSLGFALMAMTFKLSKNMRQKVTEEVNKRGLMTGDEFQQALIMNAVLQKQL